MKRRTIRGVIIEILQENPQGLAINKIDSLCSERIHYAKHNVVNVIICHLRKLGKIMRDGKRECPECGKQNIIYKWRRH